MGLSQESLNHASSWGNILRMGDADGDLLDTPRIPNCRKPPESGRDGDVHISVDVSYLDRRGLPLSNHLRFHDPDHREPRISNSDRRAKGVSVAKQFPLHLRTKDTDIFRVHEVERSDEPPLYD